MGKNVKFLEMENFRGPTESARASKLENLKKEKKKKVLIGCYKVHLSRGSKTYRHRSLAITVSEVEKKCRLDIIILNFLSSKLFLTSR